MKNSIRPILVFAAMALAVAGLLVSCGPTKNTALSRNYQAFITRYNIYYNGDTHYKETLAEMEDKYADDYSRRLFLHPIDAKNDKMAVQPSGSFDRSIEKAQKAIQVRSIKRRPKKNAGRSSDPAYKAWMKREEYNPFLHNAWMMMGRSQFYNGDFGSAAATFNYVAKHFKWLDNTVTEAQLWQARCYVEMDWLFEAETILRRIKPEQLTNKAIKEVYNYTYAGFELSSDSLARAIPYLEQALKYSSRAQKTRIHFLLGQVYASLGDKQRAYAQFHEAGKSSAASYRTKFNARIAQSEVYTGTDIEPEVKALKRMVRYDRNKEYLDQVYYAIGNLYLSRGDTVKAIESYSTAVEKSTRSGVEKALAEVSLGNLYFDRREYTKAQPCYSSGVPMLPQTYPDYKTLRRRSDVLDDLTTYAQNVELQDSLLRLADMSEADRMAVIEGIIKRLKEQEEKEAAERKREEYLAEQNAMGSNLQNNGANSPNSFVLNSDNSWYFYNQATRNAGRTEFQRRWGSRKLEDDWRRRNKASFSTSDFNSPDSEKDEDSEGAEEGMEQSELSPEEQAERQAAEEKENDPHYPEYYLKQIPMTEADRLVSNEVIQEGLYNMGIILKDKLEDYSAARDAFDRLLAEYPENVYRPEVYYNMYLMYMREGKVAEAEPYRQLLINNFPESKYGMALRDPNYIEKLKTMDERQEQLYEQTYDDYLNNRNDRVHDAFEQMQTEFPTSPIMPKFMFLHALSYVTEKRPDDFNATLRTLLERYPQADVAPIATAWLKGMSQGRKLNEGASNLRGMIWATRLSNDSTLTARADSIEFTLDPESPQLMVLLFPTDKVQSNMLLYDVARFNFNSFVVKDFDLEQMNFGRLGMLIVKGFDNTAELNHYRGLLAEAKILPKAVRPIEISEENFDKLLKSGGSFDEYFRFINAESYERTEDTTLWGDDEEEQDTWQDAESAEDNTSEDVGPLEDNDTDHEPAQTAPVQETPAPVPTPAPTPKPTPKPVSRPAAKPKTPAPAPVPLALPDYPDGSEGDDDPLLD